MKIDPAGYPFIILLAILSPITSIITLFMLYFFRDPDRKIPKKDGVVVSPADGKVIIADQTEETKYFHEKRPQVSVFMSLFNVHVNRSPMDGKVVMVKHNKGRFMPAFKEEASLKNENIEMILETGHGKTLVRQVAGLIARRTVCRAAPGDSLKRGERFGIIKFSSRVDIYMPQEYKITVKTGDTVKAGETIIAKIQKQ